MCIYIINNEDESTFDNIFQNLKDNYSFRPRNIMCDFSKAQIKSIQKIFNDCKLHCCFFHFSQCIWNKFRKYNLCGKNTYNYSELIDDENNRKIFQFTNNITENLNKQLNKYLKRGNVLMLHLGKIYFKIYYSLKINV